MPYVVEVDKLGQALAVSPAEAKFSPSDPQIAWHLGRFITHIRSRSLDAVLMRENWLSAYDFASERGAMFIGEYPLDEMQALARQRAEAEAARPVSTGIAVEQLRFHYRISGDTPAWRPLRAFDDGRQTWIEFPADLGTGEAPPLFVLGDKGEAELVNYRVAGRYYVVDRLFAAAELRLGAKEQKIVRITHLGKKPAGRRAGA